jgi:hypothetical protein
VTTGSDSKTLKWLWFLAAFAVCYVLGNVYVLVFIGLTMTDVGSAIAGIGVAALASVVAWFGSRFAYSRGATRVVVLPVVLGMLAPVFFGASLLFAPLIPGASPFPGMSVQLNVIPVASLVAEGAPVLLAMLLGPGLASWYALRGPAISATGSAEDVPSGT